VLERYISGVAHRCLSLSAPIKYLVGTIFQGKKREFFHENKRRKSHRVRPSSHAVRSTFQLTSSHGIFKNTKSSHEMGLSHPIRSPVSNCFFLNLFTGYIKTNQTKKAIDLFNEIQTPDEIVTIFLFNACAQLGTVEALKVVKKVSKEMPMCFYSNPRISSSLLDALIKCEDYSSAEILFSKMKKCVIDYGSLMSGYLKDDNPSEILNLLNKMKIDGIEANEIIYLNVIQALSRIGDYSLSQMIVEQIPNYILVDHQIQNSLIDMWVSLN
jgi:pentatricopeptide repeat protein